MNVSAQSVLRSWKVHVQYINASMVILHVDCAGLKWSVMNVPFVGTHSQEELGLQKD